MFNGFHTVTWQKTSSKNRKRFYMSYRTFPLTCRQRIIPVLNSIHWNYFQFVDSIKSVSIWYGKKLINRISLCSFEIKFSLISPLLKFRLLEVNHICFKHPKRWLDLPQHILHTSHWHIHYSPHPTSSVSVSLIPYFLSCPQHLIMLFSPYYMLFTCTFVTVKFSYVLFWAPQ